MTVINTNIKALYTQAALKLSERDGQSAMEQLSTGKRINSAKDDAAGLAIAARMTQQIKGLNQASRNAGDAISFIQTIDGASSEITNMLQRMSELSVQAANSTYSDEQRGFLDLEFQQLKQEIVRISEKYDWNGFKIMNGQAGSAIGPAPVTLTNPTATLTTSGQLSINGVAIRVPLASDDPYSNTTASGSVAERSAIAMAAAINESTSSTGVRAMATGPVVTGTVTTVASGDGGTQHLYLNGVSVPITMSATESPPARRANVIKAINNTIANHGVTASDNGTGGISLTTKDGRNLSVWFDNTSLSAGTFGLGDQRNNTITPTAVQNTSGTTETAKVTFSALAAGETVTVGGRTYTNSSAATMSGADVAAKFAASATTTTDFSGTLTSGWSINTTASSSSITLTFTAHTAVTDLTATTSAGTAPSVETTIQGSAAGTETSYVTFQDLAAGDTFTVGDLTYTASVAKTAAQVATLFGAGAYTTSAGFSGTSLTGWKAASASGSSVTFTSTTASTNVTDLTASRTNVAADGVTGIAGASASSTAGLTVYGTVTLRSDTKPILVTTTGTPSPLTVGTTDREGNELAQTAGRMSFQVGPIADQVINIDLQDFGKNGPITGIVTSDVDSTQPIINIKSVEGANAVIGKLTIAMDNVNSARSTMGAVMNRLEHVIDNLNEVSKNTEASRSQIQDADYAKASTELARTQIMQQAATAVLAQANTSQQTVLKLLQG